MTVYEAIKIIEKDRDTKCDTLDALPVSARKNAVELNDMIEAEAMAINTLEKQVAMKPIYEADGYADGELVYDYAECPICGHDFEYGINDWGCGYCSDCGQKLDWSEDND